MDLTAWLGSWFVSASSGRIETEFPYWAIKFPSGDVRHTFLSTNQQEVIDDWTKEEQMCQMISNLRRINRGMEQKPMSSWKDFEDKGYSLVRVKVVEAPN